MAPCVCWRSAKAGRGTLNSSNKTRRAAETLFIVLGFLQSSKSTFIKVTFSDFSHEVILVLISLHNRAS